MTFLPSANKISPPGCIQITSSSKLMIQNVSFSFLPLENTDPTYLTLNEISIITLSSMNYVYLSDCSFNYLVLNEAQLIYSDSRNEINLLRINFNNIFLRIVN